MNNKRYEAECPLEMYDGASVAFSSVFEETEIAPRSILEAPLTDLLAEVKRVLHIRGGRREDGTRLVGQEERDIGWRRISGLSFVVDSTCTVSGSEQQYAGRRSNIDMIFGLVVPASLIQVYAAELGEASDVRASSRLGGIIRNGDYPPAAVGIDHANYRSRAAGYAPGTVHPLVETLTDPVFLAVGQTLTGTVYQIGKPGLGENLQTLRQAAMLAVDRGLV